MSNNIMSGGPMKSIIRRIKWTFSKRAKHDPLLDDPDLDVVAQCLRDIAANSTTLTVPDSPKMLRETFCVAQSAIGLLGDSRAAEHRERLQFLIDECDRHRGREDDAS